jgi:hypothetical protein
VRNSANSAPLAGVAVELRGRGGAAARVTTDASGRAEFRGAPSGRLCTAVGADQPTILEEYLPPGAVAPTPSPCRTTQRPFPHGSGNPGDGDAAGRRFSAAGEPATAALVPSPSPTFACQQILVNGSFDGETAAWQFVPAGERAPTLCKSALALSQPCLLVWAMPTQSAKPTSP